jgi:hypothetical protein
MQEENLSTTIYLEFMSDILIPQNLTFDGSERSLPGSERAADILCYFINVVIKQSLKHGGYTEAHNGFVPLKAEYLKLIHESYDEYMTYLVEKGYLECDGRYEVGVKSKGYRLSPIYAGASYIRKEVDDYILRKCIKRQRDKMLSQRSKDLSGYNHITKWYLGNRLEIDQEAARKWANDYLEEELRVCAGMLSDIRSKKEAHKASLWFIDKIATGTIDLLDFTACKFGRRLHGIFTYHNKCLRDFIRYEGRPLVSMDIKNSQPYFSTLLLDRDFWRCEKSTTDRLRLSKIDRDIYKACKEDRGIRAGIMVLESAQTLVQRRASNARFRESVVNGTLYEDFLQALSTNLSQQEQTQLRDRISDRSQVKLEVLKTYYEKPNRLQAPYYRPSQILMSQYPDAFRMFNSIKRNSSFRMEEGKQYTLLAKIIQIVESHCVLKVICGKIAEERPSLPIFTIHDSIVTLQGNEEYVTRVMAEELIRLVGVAPQIRPERWGATFNHLQALANPV